MRHEKSRWSSIAACTHAALFLLLSPGGVGAAASEVSISGEVRVLKTELVAVGDHYLRVETFHGASGEIRIENRTRYELVMTIDIEAREEQLGPGATAVWRCEETLTPSLLSMEVSGTDAAPLQMLVACDQRMRVTKTQYPM